MIGSAVEIRPAVDADIAAVMRIERESFSDPWSEDSFRASLQPERMRFLVARGGPVEEGSEPPLLGYVIALMLVEEAEIADIAVSTKARRLGIGGLLLDSMLSEAADRGVLTMFLEVRESNSAARALYESRHFREVGRRRGYYRSPSEDALLLRRDLVPT